MHMLCATVHTAPGWLDRVYRARAVRSSRSGWPGSESFAPPPRRDVLKRILMLVRPPQAYISRLPTVVKIFSVKLLKSGLALKPSCMARLADMSAPYNGDGVYGCASGNGSA